MQDVRAEQVGYLVSERGGHLAGRRQHVSRRQDTYPSVPIVLRVVVGVARSPLPAGPGVALIDTAPDEYTPNHPVGVVNAELVYVIWAVCEYLH